MRYDQNRWGDGKKCVARNRQNKLCYRTEAKEISISSRQFKRDANGHVWYEAPYEILRGTIAEMQPIFEEIAERRADGQDISGVQLKVPKSLGQGSWCITRSSPYMFTMTATVNYIADEYIRVSEDRMAKARILLSGRLKQFNSGITLDGTGAYIEAFPGNVGSDYCIYGGMPARLVVLNAEPRLMTKSLGLQESSVPFPLSHVFTPPGSPAEGGIASLGPNILRAANDLYHAQQIYLEPLFRTYIDAKSHELMCSIIHDLGRQLTDSAAKIRLSVRDVNRISEAREILIEQFRKPPSIPGLARQVGVNQTKLKAVFKAVYGLTIHEFIQKQRMDLALDLLGSSEFSISEIAYEVGYEYPASFTHAFNKYFGHSPRQARRASEI